MNAAVSGRAGIALLLDGERLFSFDVEEQDRLVQRRRSDLPYIFGGASDLRYPEDVTLEEARAGRPRGIKSSLGLDLPPILLSPQHSKASRTTVSVELYELCA